MKRSPAPSMPDQKGVALVEMAILITLFLIILAGMIDIGSVLWQNPNIQDALRVSGRNTAAMTNSSNNCSDLRIYAENQFEEYIDRSPSLLSAVLHWWDPVPTVNFNATASWGSQVVFPIVEVEVGVRDDTQTCLFCYLPVLHQITTTNTSTFSMEGGPCT